MSSTDRETMEFDVVIVGAGPSGLATAIRLKQLSPTLNIVVLEKGAEVGAHTLSGAVVDPRPLDALLPGWRQEDTPFKTAVTEDVFRLLGKSSSLEIPAGMMPRLMSNHGNYIVSLGSVCRWLARKAEELGVEIYAGFGATELLVDDSGRTTGVATGDMGRTKDGTEGVAFQPGMSLLGRFTVLAEGTRGSLTKAALARYDLARGREPQKYGIGLKELWEVPESQHHRGRVEHSFGWPLGWKTGGGSFLYHLENNQVAVGYVVHLNYDNPYLSPFEEFQRFKLHPTVRCTLEGGRRLTYGSRVISEGGWQSVPRLSFPGGLLVGDAAGFVNLPRVKGTHNAIASGMLAAGHVVAAFAVGEGATLDDYEKGWRSSPIGEDLHRVRNMKPLWSRLGLPGVALGALDLWCQQLVGFSPFGTLKHVKPDHACLKPAASCRPITYPKADGALTFDRPSSVFISNTNHREGQPVHLRVADLDLQRVSELGTYAGPSEKYCPAGVYEWIDEVDGPRFQINAQNCVHCKTCEIKDPNQNITWVPPEGGGGPNYSTM